jgi:hypothetical protein
VRADDAFDIAGGRFITKYAEAERSAHLFAMHCSGGEEDCASIALPDIELPEIQDKIRTCYSEADQLEHLLLMLVKLQTQETTSCVRDYVHWRGRLCSSLRCAW